MKTFTFNAFEGIWKKVEHYQLTEEDAAILKNGTQLQISELGMKKTAFEQKVNCNEDEVSICENYLESKKPNLKTEDNFVLLSMSFIYRDKPYGGAMNFKINGQLQHIILPI